MVLLGGDVWPLASHTPFSFVQLCEFCFAFVIVGLELWNSDPYTYEACAVPQSQSSSYNHGL